MIINGDDFGASPEVNAAILKGHREGLLNSASLMVAGEARDEAAAIARHYPALDVGLHAVVCRGRSVLGPERLAGLVDGDGYFVTRPVLGGLRYFFDRPVRAALEAELRAQIEAHLKLVGYLDHLDGHLNFHVHPAIADILVECATEYRIPCIRIPREPLLITLALARDHLARKLAEAMIFRALASRTRRIMAARGIRSADWLFGLHQSGNLSERYLLGVIDRLPEGVIEIYFHPAADLGRGAPLPSAQAEVELLTSPRVRRALERRAVRLITYRELARISPPAV